MSFNPFDVQKQMFAEFEKNMGEYIKKTMREPAVMKLLAQNMSASLQIKGLVKEQLEKVLDSLDIPTQTKMAGLYKTVHNLETRMLDMEEQIEDLEEALAKSKKAAKVAPKKAAPKKVVKKPVAKKVAPKKVVKLTPKKVKKISIKPVAKKATKASAKKS